MLILCRSVRRLSSRAASAPAPTRLAAFGRTEDAAAALDELLNAGFINVEQEVEGERTVLVVDAGPRENQARQMLAAHGGVEFDPPG
jgi:hypothetical protein